tara:strand:+ start:196 stop:912 length:717 start_codon:yes stop_codon:yes gene_type:complete
MECIIYKIMTAKDKKDEKKKIFSEENILEYLVKNPNLINHNIDLFNKLFSLDKNKGNIISFEDIRIKSLINENNILKNKLEDIIKTAKSNNKIQEKLSKFSNEVISIRDIELLVNYVEDFIEKEFPDLKIKLKIIKFNGFDCVNKKYFAKGKLIDLINSSFLQKKSTLSSKETISKYSLGEILKNQGSVVLSPLGIEYPIGLILVGYKSEMMGIDLQFDLLNSLAETISYSLEQYIQK